MNSVTCADEDGRTPLSHFVPCPHRELRDAIVDSGMETGLQGRMETLEGVAVSPR